MRIHGAERALAVLLSGLIALFCWGEASANADPTMDIPAVEHGTTQELHKASTYTISSAPTDVLQLDPPKLPDVSGVTPEAAAKKLAAIPRTPAKVSIRPMAGEDTLKQFTGSDGRLAEWTRRQHAFPRAIFVDSGFLRLADLTRHVPKSLFEQTSDGVYVLRLPLVVAHGATLSIDSGVKELRLSEDKGSFIVNDGTLFVTDTRVLGWRERANQQAWFKLKGLFRPFVLGWGGSETYIVNSEMSSLGYTGSKAYGISLSQYSPSMHGKMNRPRPTGWLLNSTFADNWYGFYCYEADDVVIKGNVYRDNIVYGIDPHDRSRRLVITENEAYGTHKKHGIIVSREVDDSWIFNNVTHDNHLSGIVVDRTSVNNVVAYNYTYQNESDGITIYESGDNLLWGNRSVENRRHGIRLRNSVNVRLYENLSINNGLTGIYGHIKDLTNTDRNIALDPFDTKVSMTVVGGKLIGNGSAPVSIDSPLSVELYDVEMLAPPKASGITLTGVLGDKQDEIMDMLFRQKQAVLIDPVETQAEMNR